MKITTSTRTRGSMTAQGTTMRIAPEAVSHLMNVLQNMYRDKSRAVLREYSTNARDSHIEAGTDRPVEVTLPTSMNPNLTIRDYGIGLSQEEIEEVYGWLGRSTKRGDDTQVGAFGIGSKSAFTLATQLLVTGFKDGQRTDALFALNAAGEVEHSILANKATDEPNGVLIQVPCDDIEAMHTQAHSLFSTWSDGTVLVDGEPPVNAYTDMFDVGGGVHMGTDIKIVGEHPAYAVMGGIAYPLTKALLEQMQNNGSTHAREAAQWLLRRVHALIDVPVGAVDITPSREDLRDSPRTMRALDDALAQFRTGAVATIQKTLDDAPTAMDGVLRTRAMRKVIGYAWQGTFTWRGTPLEGAVRPGFPMLVFDPKRMRTQNDREPRLTLDGDNIDTLLVVTGIDSGNEPTVRRLARRYFLAQDATANAVRSVMLARPNTYQSGWFSYGNGSAVKTMPAEQFIALAKALPTPSASRDTESARTGGGVTYTVAAGMVGAPRWQATGPEIDAHEGRVVVLPDNKYDHDLIASVLAPTDLIVHLRKRQTLSGIQRRCKRAEDGMPLLAAGAAAYLAAFTDDQRDAAVLDSGLGWEAKREYDALLKVQDRLTHPEITSAVRRITRLIDLKDTLDRNKAIIDHAMKVAGVKHTIPVIGLGKRSALIGFVANYANYGAPRTARFLDEFASAVNALPNTQPVNVPVTLSVAA